MIKNNIISKIKTLILASILMLVAQFARADYYLNFNDGSLHVFPSNCIQSMTVNSSTVEFIAKDGGVYTYQRSTISSIGYQLSKEMPSFTSFKFNNKYNYQLVSDAVGVISENSVKAQVAGIGKWLTPSFEVSDPKAIVTINGRQEKSHEGRHRFDPSINYTVGWRTDLILKKNVNGTYSMIPYGKTYQVEVDFLTDHSEAAPRIDINTVGGVNITSKEEYVDAEIIIDGAGVFPSMTDSVQIKGRGNSSWSTNPNAKNPYRLKFAKKVKPLGLTKGKSWVLLANKISGSMMTNAYGMKLASLIGLPAANHIIPVDLYINGVYKGSYNFTEKVGFANNSIDLEDESAAALLELDYYYDEPTGQRFHSSYMNLPVCIKEPEFDEGTTQLTLLDIKSRFNDFAYAVYYRKTLVPHADIDYLARYLLVNEIICNYEIFHPKSVFLYNENILNENKKFIFGPLWDLDYAFGYETDYNYFKSNTSVDYYTATNFSGKKFFVNIGKNKKVNRRMYQLCKKLIENDLTEMIDFCQDYYEYASLSLNNNNNAPYASDYTYYNSQATLAEKWFKNRIVAVFERLQEYKTLTGDADLDGEVNIGDVTAIISYLLSGDASNIDIYTADINEDGEINIADVTDLITILLTSQ